MDEHVERPLDPAATDREAKIAAMQRLIDEAYASGFLEDSPEEIFEEALRAANLSPPAAG